MELPFSSALSSLDLAPGLLWFGLAFLLGLVHAFDADHVMAVSVLATRDPRTRGSAASAGWRWGLGHGLVLLAAGGLLFLAGRGLPEAWSAFAERGVGCLMIALGISVFWGLLRRGNHLHFHTHDGIPPHAHWHAHAKTQAHPPPDAHHHEHVPSLVGALHGLAGSAPILALLPAAARSPWLGLAYLLLFSVGVGCAMALVSGLLGRLAAGLSRSGQTRALSGLRAASAFGSIAIGGWLAVTG